MVEKSRKSVKTVCVGSSWSPTLQRQHETAPLVLFSPNEVPPDSQAWLSIFKNRSSVSNIINVTPSYIGGVDGGSQGLRINQEKDFEELGRVACKTIAAANSLSKARPHDGDKIVSYDYIILKTFEGHQEDILETF